MQRTRAFLGILIMLLLAGAGSVISQEKNTPPQNTYTYDLSTQHTVSGSVIGGRDFQCPVSGTLGSHITVKTETGAIEVHLAPTSFIKQYEILIRKDDNVTVVGSRIMFEGKPALIAKSIVIGRDTYNFRDPKGRPLW
jgi:hypothetical protein